MKQLANRVFDHHPVIFSKRTKIIVAVFSVLFITILFIVIRWNFYSVPFDRDEGEYAYSAWIMHEGISPYKNSFMQKPPLIIYTYYLAQQIDTDSLWPPRMLATLFLAGTIVLVGMIAYKEKGKRTGIVAAAIMTAMFSFPYLMVNSANTEEFMILPAVGLLALYVFYRKQTKSWHWILGGVLSAISLLYKPIGVFVILFILITWIKEQYLPNKRYKDIFPPIGLVLVGFISTVLLSTAYFLAKGSLNDLFESVVTFNLYYANEQGYGFSSMLPHLKLFFGLWWIVILFLIYYALARPKCFWFYAGLLFFSLLGIYQSAVGHYYIAILPFLALITAFSIEELVSKGILKDQINSNLLAALATVATIYVLILPIRHQYWLSPNELSTWVYGRDNPFVESEEVAQKVQTFSENLDKVFVAGSEPQILWYARRKSPTRFVISYPYSMNTEKAGEYQQEVISSLSEDPAKVIVLSQRQSSGFVGRNSPTLLFNYLMISLSSGYELKGGYVWKDGNLSGWQDEFKENEISKASLLVFVRK